MNILTIHNIMKKRWINEEKRINEIYVYSKEWTKNR